MATIYDQVKRLRSDLETLGADLLETDEVLRTEFRSWGLKGGAKALRKTAKRLQDLGDTAVNQASDLNTKILEKVGDSQERAQKMSVLLGETASRLERRERAGRSGGIGRRLAKLTFGLAIAGAVAALMKEMCRKP